jgi:hypothetical protein
MMIIENPPATKGSAEGKAAASPRMRNSNGLATATKILQRIS